MLSMDLATPQVPGTFVYNPPAGTVEPVGTDTLSVTFTPTDTVDYTTATGSVQLVVTNPDTPIVTPTISWPTPAPITWGTPLSSTQLNAVAMGAPRPTPVIPTSQLQVIATSTDGTPYNQPGFDDQGGTYSYNQLGNGSVVFAGSTFNLGQPTVPDAITDGAVYTLDDLGQLFSSLPDWRRDHHRADKPALRSQVFQREPGDPDVDMSSWAQPAGYADELIVATTPYKNTQAGGKVAGTFDLYGYQIPLTPPEHW